MDPPLGAALTRVLFCAVGQLLLCPGQQLAVGIERTRLLKILLRLRTIAAALFGYCKMTGV